MHFKESKSPVASSQGEGVQKLQADAIQTCNSSDSPLTKDHVP